jgi:tetratricopeptide (TPR) repeat protein
LRGQLNLFPEPEGQLIRLPLRLSPFEEALVLHERGSEGAAEAYRKAIRLDDCVADAYCNLGILEFEGGRITEAFDCFTCSLSHDPRHFESHYNLANLYFEAVELRLARLHYEISAQIEPSFPNLYFNLGLVHAVNGDLVRALAVLSKAKEMDPDGDHKKIDDLLATLSRVLAESLTADTPPKSGGMS